MTVIGGCVFGRSGGRSWRAYAAGSGRQGGILLLYIIFVVTALQLGAAFSILRLATRRSAPGRHSINIGAACLILYRESWLREKSLRKVVKGSVRTVGSLNSLIIQLNRESRTSARGQRRFQALELSTRRWPVTIQ